MTSALLHFPGHEYRLFIAPERTRVAGVYNDKGARAGGLFRATDGDGIGTKQAKNGGKA